MLNSHPNTINFSPCLQLSFHHLPYSNLSGLSRTFCLQFPADNVAVLDQALAYFSGLISIHPPGGHHAALLRHLQFLDGTTFFYINYQPPSILPAWNSHPPPPLSAWLSSPFSSGDTFSKNKTTTTTKNFSGASHLAVFRENLAFLFVNREIFCWVSWDAECLMAGTIAFCLCVTVP